MEDTVSKSVSLSRWTVSPQANRTAKRLRSYLSSILSKGVTWWRVDLSLISRSFRISKRTAERALAWVRENCAEFSFKTKRAGRSFFVEVSGRQKLPIKVFCCAKKYNSKHGGAGFGFGAKVSTAGLRKLTSLAAFIARRELADLHWDNCKVLYRFPHAFLFCLRALKAGHKRERLTACYSNALHQRHKDATDTHLNSNALVSERWEPSSTVTLAQRLLADGLHDSERVAERFNALLPIKQANARLAAECAAAFA